ncbi:MULTISPECIES: cupin domain-containing protein [Sandaracinus]|uniref:cupin domain-containing protein n=1 Tax=Sandaracinus TaxID=1055688 RepID=UPI001AFCC28F|nr:MULTISPECIES: cupin domain-containing protein [Sandaracinus]QRN75830.1 Hypothetical protein MSR10575_89170 [Sandaracinus sp.]UJR87368.1 Hypothetical protein I5071_1600 [Sandaracinus amylolyticus]
MVRPFVVMPAELVATRAIRTSTGEPLGWVRSLLDDAASPLRVDLVELPPGERIAPEHAHSMRDEAFFVIEGEVAPVIAGAELPVMAARSLFVVPRGETTATLRNRGTTPAIVLQISAAIGEDVVTHASSELARD